MLKNSVSCWETLVAEYQLRRKRFIFVSKKLCSDYDMKFLIGQKQACMYASMLSFKNDECGSQRSQNSYKGAEKIV